MYEKVKLEGSDICIGGIELTPEQKRAAAAAEEQRQAAIKEIEEYLAANVSRCYAAWEDEDDQATASWLDVSENLHLATLENCQAFLAGGDLWIMTDDQYLVVYRKK